MNYCRTLIFIYFASIALGTGNRSALEVERKDDVKAKFTGKVKKGGPKILSKSQRCCEGNDVLLCVNIELDPSTITSKKNLHLEPLNATLVFKEMIGRKEFKYGNDEFDLTFVKQNSKGTFGFSDYKNDGRVLLIENCKKNRYVLKIVIREDAKNVLKDQELKGITVENCRFNGATMILEFYYVARDYYRSTCINRCSQDKLCYAWTWDSYYGYCFLYKPTFSSYGRHKASGPDRNGKSCVIGSKRCWTYYGITHAVYVGNTGAGVNSASSCEDRCKSSNVCNYWYWYFDTCYFYATRYTRTYRYHSAEWC